MCVSAIRSACRAALVLALLGPGPAVALPYVLPLPAEARSGVTVSASEKAGILALELKLNEKLIGARVSAVRLTVTDQMPDGKYRSVLDVPVATRRDKDGALVADFHLERKAAAAADVVLALAQDRDVPGGTWYTFGLDEFIDLFNDLPAWKLRQKLRRYADTAPMRGAARPKADPVRPGPGLIGRTSVDGKDIGLVFRYEHGRVFRHELVEEKVVDKLDRGFPHRGVEVVLRGRLEVPRAMTVRARMAGGSVSHGIHTLMIDGQEVGSVGDNRQKSRTDLLSLAGGTHPVQWVLRGGRFGNNLLRFEDPQTGDLLPLSFAEENLKEVGPVPAKDVVPVTSDERGWPIPQGW
jgi:hypothetical protein